MSQHCQLSMLEIAKSLLLCQNHHGDGDGSDLEGLTPREGHSTEKLKFKLIGLQLVNQIFCRKLRKRREESERLSNIIDDKDSIVVPEEIAPKSPRLSFREVHDGECLKSLVAIRFDDCGHTVSSSEKANDSAGQLHRDKRDRFVEKEGVQMRCVSLKDYNRRFSKKNLKSGNQRHHSLKVHRKFNDLKGSSCPDLGLAVALKNGVESVSPSEARLQAYDSVDDFTSQLFAEHILPNSHEDLLSICFE